MIEKLNSSNNNEVIIGEPKEYPSKMVNSLIKYFKTDKNITINGNLGAGAKAGASADFDKHKQEISVEGGMGITGKLNGKIEDQDFKTETTKDFAF